MVRETKKYRLEAVAGLWCVGLLGMALLGGCAFIRGTYGDEFNPAQLAYLQKGVSTRQEVIFRLGAPDKILEVNGHEIFNYFRYDMKSAAVVAFSKTNIMSDNLYIAFNRDGIVQEVIYSQRTNHLVYDWWPF